MAVIAIHSPFYIRFQNTVHLCNSLSEVQRTINTNIAPYLKGYTPNSKMIKNIPFNYGRNKVVLKDGIKASFTVIKYIQYKKKENSVKIAQNEMSLLYEKGFFVCGEDDSIVVITKKKLEELGIELATTNNKENK